MLRESLECEVCCEVFNTDIHRPKNIPCGHTMCLSCLERCSQNNGTICPKDGKHYETTPRRLPDALFVLQLLDVVHGNYQQNQQLVVEERTFPQNQVGHQAEQSQQSADITQATSAAEAEDQAQAASDDTADTAPEELCISSISQYGGRREKDSMLTCRYRKLTGVHCDRDPLWVEQLLRSNAVFLEELELYNPSVRHDQMLDKMPWLQRLRVYGSSYVREGDRAAVEFQRRRSPEESSLRYVKFRGWREQTAASLLAGHRFSLEQVDLSGSGRAHLQLLEMMPLLRKLTLRDTSWTPEEDPLVFNSVSAECSSLVRVRFLGLKGDNNIPKETISSLLVAHGRTLEEVILQVDTDCDLDVFREYAMTAHAAMQAGARFALTFERHCWGNPARPMCASQLDAARALLPRLTVRCRH